MDHTHTGACVSYSWGQEPSTATQDPEEPLVQVLGDRGLWHRTASGHGHRITACGISVARGTSIRHERYDGNLCEECFTAFELVASARANRQIRIQEEE